MQMAVCFETVGCPPACAGASLIVSHQRRLLASVCWCITYCVTPAPIARQRVLVHHLLCRTSAGCPPACAGASLIVSHQRRLLVSVRWCITYCVAPAPIARQRVLVHHLLCHTSAGCPPACAGASLIVSHQRRLLASVCWCITYCVAPAPIARQRALVHHLLCHTSADCSPACALASLIVSHQRRLPVSVCSCITYCVTPAPVARQRVLVHHLLCRTSS